MLHLFDVVKYDKHFTDLQRMMECIVAKQKQMERWSVQSEELWYFHFQRHKSVVKFNIFLVGYFKKARPLYVWRKIFKHLSTLWSLCMWLLKNHWHSLINQNKFYICDHQIIRDNFLAILYPPPPCVIWCHLHTHPTRDMPFFIFQIRVHAFYRL